MKGQLSMIDTIIKALENNQSQSLIVAGVVVFIIWLYRTNRNELIETEKNNSIRCDKALEIYGELQNQIVVFLDSKFDVDTLLIKIFKAYPFLPYDMLKKIIQYQEQKSDDILHEFQADLGKEIYRIKLIQKDGVTYRAKNNIITEIDVFFHDMRIDTFYKPVISTFLTLLTFIVFSLIFITFISPQIDWKAKVTVGSALYILLIHGLILLGIGQKVLQKKFINTKPKWLYLWGFLIIPSCWVFWGPWYAGLISVILGLFYIGIILPRSIKDKT